MNTPLEVATNASTKSVLPVCDCATGRACSDFVSQADSRRKRTFLPDAILQVECSHPH